MFGCTCTQQATPDEKSYNCRISTIQGDKPGTGTCSRSAGSCTMQAEGYTLSMSFQEIRQKYG